MPIEFKDVAKRLTCEEFARSELPMKGNRAKCPFHGGEHYNLQFFKDGKCYCHVCHKSGDVVTLAAAVWHMGQMDAARELNERYRLGLGDCHPNRELLAQRQQEQAARDEERRQREKQWLANCDEFLRVADEFRAARAILQRYVDDGGLESEAGQAAVEKALDLHSRYCCLWFDMTGEYPDNVPLQGW